MGGAISFMILFPIILGLILFIAILLIQHDVNKIKKLLEKIEKNK
jgi:hypothetical protein